MTHEYRRGYTDEERRAFLKALGVAGAAGLVGEFTLGDLRSAVTVESSGELAAVGEAIRGDLEGSLDASLLGGGSSALAERMGRLPELAAAGVPETPGTEYQQLTEPAWRVNEHLLAVGFYETAERHLPPFTAEHVASTTRRLVAMESLAPMLSEVGFDGREGAELVMNVVNNSDHLAKWVPIDMYPPEAIDDFDPADIAPLHQRAAEGSLLWIDGLDRHLWQNEVLLTETAIERGLGDVKAMLGGFYLLGRAAEGLARGTLDDEELTALVTGSSAIMIVGQEDLADDLVRITEPERAPRTGGGR